MDATYFICPSVEELDTWKDTIAPEGDMTTTAIWDWDNMFTNMKKAGNLTVPDANIVRVMDIQYDASTHWSDGPMRVSYSMSGVSTLTTLNVGSTIGGFTSPSFINPTNWTPSYSKSANIDSLPRRSNLHILADMTVTCVVFGMDKDQNGNFVKTKREGMLAGGAMGSLKVWMHCGVDLKDIVDAVGVQVELELPGVDGICRIVWIAWATPLETTGDIHVSRCDFSRIAESLSCIRTLSLSVTSVSSSMETQSSNSESKSSPLCKRQSTLICELDFIEGYRLSTTALNALQRLSRKRYMRVNPASHMVQ
ncbi:hypothetical protein BJ165DRAFT_1533570 [Panaeolus papilionaceus]|nr:hypothetical protein BJ165DRAFT_1533570 [Panaeolus papilionaceus]